ncbi:MAG: hypothetical protein M3R17_14480 [Bacteroidota bacterium]|nr:hypothetical protein [Bacteroidota bacterium]
MKKIISATLIYFLIVLLAACGPENNYKIPPDDTLVNEEYSDGPIDDLYEDSERDTIYPMEIQGKAYQLMFTHDEYRSSRNDNKSTITVRIVENATSDTLYYELIKFNSIGRFFHPSPDHYLVNLTEESGGSGYSGTLYNIRFNPEITLQPVTNFNELSFWECNKAATEILFFQASWEMNAGSTDNFEAHFSEHRQSVGIYRISQDTVIYDGIGFTKYKYDLHNHKFEENGNDSIILRIKKQEPALAKKVKWEEYDFEK